MRRLAQRAAVIGLVLGAVVAPGTVVADDRATPGAPAPRATERQAPAVTPPHQCICTTEYDPVCGRMPNGAEITFSNPCRAGCAGATVIRRGPC